MNRKQYYDMVEFADYGKKCSKYFSTNCIKDIQEVMNSSDIDKLDYNFLCGIKYALIKRKEDNQIKKE